MNEFFAKIIDSSLHLWANEIEAQRLVLIWTRSSIDWKFSWFFRRWVARRKFHPKSTFYFLACSEIRLWVDNFGRSKFLKNDLYPIFQFILSIWAVNWKFLETWKGCNFGCMITSWVNFFVKIPIFSLLLLELQIGTKKFIFPHFHSSINWKFSSFFHWWVARLNFDPKSIFLFHARNDVRWK
jgi:hypothetical protein